MSGRLWTLACALVAGCAFGGGSDDPTDGVSFLELDGGEDVAMDDATASDAAPLDASVRADAGNPSDAGAADSGAGMCTPSKPLAACDPVKNTGCDFLQQCDLDSAGMAQAGRCVFFNPLSFGGCGSDDFSSTCTGGNACIANACQKLCYCDRDCGTGKKCTGSAPGAAGAVKFCQ